MNAQSTGKIINKNKEKPDHMNELKKDNQKSSQGG
jgi:hypothetical protein